MVMDISGLSIQIYNILIYITTCLTIYLTFYYLKAELAKEAMEETRFRELLEQERRDHELAVRLAQESNGQVEEDSPPPVRR